MLKADQPPATHATGGTTRTHACGVYGGGGRGGTTGTHACGVYGGGRGGTTRTYAVGVYGGGGGALLAGTFTNAIHIPRALTAAAFPLHGSGLASLALLLCCRAPTTCVIH